MRGCDDCHVITDTQIIGRALGERYRSLAQASIAKYRGRHIVRFGAVEPVEGEWRPELFVIVEFPKHGAGAFAAGRALPQ
jgi:uncharacterized protein (DUF1330 family)